MFLIRHGGLLFGMYIAVALASFLLVHTPFNEAFTTAALWLGPPIEILYIGFVVVYYEPIRQHTRYSSFKVWLFTLMSAAVLTLFAWPCALLLNALTGHGQTTSLGGRVIDKFRTSGRSIAHVLVLQPAQARDPVRLTVASDTYENINMGQFYAECFNVGGLRFAYRWRYSDTQPTCETTPSAP